ncbi:4Fe-4S binding protein [Neobacillus niacini]|uniref:4Fe-4S binding protein n=1 Tax=Neobacillus niacini TaxID=86668 RepID=UPI0021CB176B|nr:4Fe-4S binding protein [Neobacillus niacini]MCM3766228.1 4Fe-4S binding protein [Neobacillus niacini]
MMKRQNVRKLVLISSMLLFPITIWYFSPELIILGAIDGVVTGSFIVFIAMLISSIFLGRLFCGYLCPAGGIQECGSLINDKPPSQGWKNNIKYVIWILWIIGIVFCFLFRKHELTVDFFYMTDHGISIANIYDYVVYYGVVFLIFIPSIIFGKRIFCHYFCWMAPFLVIGMKIGNLLHIKRLRLQSNKELCINCHICDKSCPMSLKVSEKVKKVQMDDHECI